MACNVEKILKEHNVITLSLDNSRLPKGNRKGFNIISDPEASKEEKRKAVHDLIQINLKTRQTLLLDAYGKTALKEEYVIQPPSREIELKNQKIIERISATAAENILNNSILIGGLRRLSDFIETSSKKLNVLFHNSKSLSDYLNNTKEGAIAYSKYSKEDKQFVEYIKRNTEGFNSFVHGDKDNAPILPYMTDSRFGNFTKGKAIGNRAVLDEYTDMYQYLLQKAETGGYTVDPMVIEATGIAITNWLATQATGTFINTWEDINRLFGRNTSEWVKPKHEEKFTDIGASQASVIDSLGPEIFSMLGFKAKVSDVDGSVAPRLKVALGALAVAYMIDRGTLQQTAVPATDFPSDTGTISESQQTVGKDTLFVKIVNQENIETLSEIRKATEAVPELLNLENYKVFPGSKPSTHTPKFMRGTRQQTPERTGNTIRNIQQDKWTVRNSTVNKFFELDEATQAIVTGRNTDIENAHVTQRKSLQAVNNRIDRSLDNIKEFIGKLRKPQQSFYMKYFVSRGGRLFIDNNTIDPIQDKLIRHMIGLKSHLVSVEGLKLNRTFQLAVAQAFGYGIDKHHFLDSLKEFKSILAATKDAVNALKKNVNDRTPEDIIAIQEAVKLGGEKMHTFEALLALTKYSPDKPFLTTLGIETDAVTSGVMIGNMLSLLDGVEDLASGGVFLDNVTTDYPSHAALPNSMDLYQKLTAKWQKVISDMANKNKNNAKAISIATRNIIGSFIKEGNLISDIGREFSKDPLMVTNYGSALKKAKENFAYAVLNQFYSKIAKAEDAELMVLGNALETLIKEIIPIDQKLDKDFVLTHKQQDTFIKSVLEVHGEALTMSLEDRLGNFIKYREKINKAFQIMFYTFNKKFEIALEAKKEELGRIPSLEETEALLDTLRKFMPIVKGPLSKGLDDGIIAIKGGLRRNYIKAYQVQISFSRPLRNTAREEGTSSITSYAKSYKFLDPGVAGTVTNIHNIDSVIQQAVLSAFAALNVHDAAVYSLADVAKGTGVYNKSFIDVVTSYDLMQEVSDSLNNVIESVRALPEEERSQISTHLSENLYSKNDKGKRIAFNLIQEIAELEELHTEVKAARESLLKDHSHIAVNHSAYHDSESVYILETKNVKPLDSSDGPIAAVFKEIESFKGSIGRSIDFENFTSLFSGVIDATTIQTIFSKLEDVGVEKESTAHTATLQELLDNFIKLQHDIDIKVGESGDTTIGAQRTFTDGTQDIHVLGSVTGNKNNVKMSAQETYVHELIHAVTEYAVDTNSGLRRGLKQIFALAEKNTTWRDFLPKGKDFTADEVRTAKETYEYLFNNSRSYKDPVSGRTVNPYLHEFVAYGLSNERFAAKLSTLTVRNRTKREGSLWERLVQWYKDALKYAANKLRGIENLTADKALRKMLDQALTASEKQKRSIFRMFNVLDSANQITVDKIHAWIFAPAAKYARKDKPKRIPGRVLHTLAGLLDSKIYAELGSVIKQVSRNIGITERNFFVKLVREIQQQKGNNAVWHSLLRASKHIVDQARMHEATNVIKHLRKGFHTEVTTEESEALYKIFIKLDLVSLLDTAERDKYTPDNLLGLLSSDSSLDLLITSLEKQIRKEYKANGLLYINQAEGLGSKMATSNTVDWQLNNAYAIANAAGLGIEVSGDLNRATKLIDELASLYGIKHSKQDYRNLAHAVYKRENAVDGLDNGIAKLFSLHKLNKEMSLEKLFHNNKMQTEKGYSKETFDPRVDVRTATADQIDILISEGYTYAAADKKPLTMDISDKSEKRWLMVNPNGGDATWVKAIVSLTAKKHQGEALQDIYQAMDPEMSYRDAKIKTAGVIAEKRLKAYRQLSQRVKPTETVKLQPIVSEHGNAVNLRYLMSEHNKDSLLNRDNRFDHVLGRMFGSIVDKTGSTEINKKVLIEAKKEFEQNKSTQLREYVNFTETSSDPEIAEMYKLMPLEMKKAIKSIWGENEDVYIREEFLNLIFGFRKMKFTDKKNFVGGTIRSVNKTLTWLLGNTLFPKAPNVDIEKLWIATVKIAKENIVIKTGVILLPNFVSNNLILFAKGVNPRNIATYQAEALVELENYQKDLSERDITERELQSNIKLSANKRKKLELKLSRLQDSVDNNPVAELIDEGIFQNIIEDINLEEDIYSGKAKLAERAKELADKYLHEYVATSYKYLYMDKTTGPYKLLLRATQVSDFIARFALYKHRTSNVPKKFKSRETRLEYKQKVLKEVVETFVNYDVVTSKELQTINDLGAIMFTKFFFRKFKIIFSLFTERAASMISILAVEKAFGEADSIDDNPFNIWSRVNFPDDIVEEAAQLPAISWL